MNEYGFNDSIYIYKGRSYIDTLLIYKLQPFDKNFQTMLIPKVILAKFLSQDLLPWTNL